MTKTTASSSSSSSSSSSAAAAGGGVTNNAGISAGTSTSGGGMALRPDGSMDMSAKPGHITSPPPLLHSLIHPHTLLFLPLWSVIGSLYYTSLSDTTFLHFSVHCLLSNTLSYNHHMHTSPPTSPPTSLHCSILSQCRKLRLI